ncbi:MAG TPA: thioredoxin domain-containing protein [Anaerolineales bacterium]|nr:thioredoxin domain-containing protein [Anaerolineales bacterium]
MPNHLRHENSPYLLQHVDNPVDWYPWHPDALTKARNEDKPIFLSIGYAACHWCHVMAHESFEDPGTAAVLNEHFISIKVDREERPDLDNIYMQAVVAMTGQGGWPMSVFLTPEGQPFFGGTYFPPVRRYNMPAFQDVLLTIARLWQQDRQQLLTSAKQITEHIKSAGPLTGSNVPSLSSGLDEAVTNLAKSYDWQNGGWGVAPKFPQPMTIEFLLRRSTRGDKLSGDMATHALLAMAKGGMYDVVGGGFARYSTDNEWRIPHFEKMLYDNAQLALVYLHAYLITGISAFRRTCEETLDFVSRELLHPLGGFYSSLDADSEGVEGAYYAWSVEDIGLAIPDQDDRAVFIAAYGISDTGNFDGKNVLQRSLTDEQLALQFSLPVQDIPALLFSLHRQLLELRQTRNHPGTDDKIILSWNALMLNTFAEAGRYLGRQNYTRLAMRNGRFLLENLYQDGHLLRSWRNGQARHNAYLEDYASLILALLSLYQVNPNLTWFTSAARLADEMVDRYQDSTGGFFDTSADHELLLIRPKDLQDNATPSGNALAAMALLQLSAYTGNTRWHDHAEQMLNQILPSSSRYPTAFSQWLSAIDFSLGPVDEIAILGDVNDERTSQLQEFLWSQFRPRLIAAISAFPIPPGSPALLHNRTLVRNQTTVYVCQNHTCKYPVTTVNDLREQLTG